MSNDYAKLMERCVFLEQQNVHLRRANSELLAALEDLVSRCTVTYGADAHYTANARAAIAKATDHSAPSSSSGNPEPLQFITTTKRKQP